MASPSDFSSDHPAAMVPFVPPPLAVTRKQAPGQPWSHIETVSLIEAYEDKWSAVRRGQLKAQQWEEVAASVGERCAAAGFGNVGQSKTGTQCRHKVEKLRKRYRAERARPVASLWPYFREMERLERGPAPISGSAYSSFRPPAFESAYSSRRPASFESPYSSRPDLEDEDEEDDEDEEEVDHRPPNHTKNINGLVRDAGFAAGRPPPVLAPPRKRVRYEMMQQLPQATPVNDDEEDDDDEELDRSLSNGNGDGVMSALAVALKRFGEGMVRIEQRRMELRREIERDWMAMEARRSEMVMEAQRRLMGSLAAALGEQRMRKKARKAYGSSMHLQ